MFGDNISQQTGTTKISTPKCQRKVDMWSLTWKDTITKGTGSSFIHHFFRRERFKTWRRYQQQNGIELTWQFETNISNTYSIEISCILYNIYICTCICICICIYTVYVNRMWPPPSTSDQKDYYMFSRGFLWPALATVTGREQHPMYIYKSK